MFKNLLLCANNYLQKALALLLPRDCLYCKRGRALHYNLCQSCLPRLPIVTNVCLQCARPVSTRHIKHCGNCLATCPPYTYSHALFPYAPPIRQWLLKLKFSGRWQLADLFGNLMVIAMQERWYKNKPLPDLLIPVPLHPSRLRERGYNQALEISKPLSQKLNIPLERHGCIRKKATLPQSRLSLRKRKQNMTQAFISKRNYSGLTVAIIDDVVTTGHTVSALAHLLKKQGAKEVHILSVARS